MRSELFRVGFLVSHPSAKNAHGWGTQHFEPMKKGTAAPSTSLCFAQDDRFFWLTKKGKCGR